MSAPLLPNHLDQHPLPALAIKFAIENLLPGAQVQLAFGDRHDDFPAHDGALEVGVGVVFTGIDYYHYVR